MFKAEHRVFFDGAVPYEIAMGLIYIYHEHRIYGIKCTHKICFVPVGAIHESPVNVDAGLRDAVDVVPYEIVLGFGANKHHEICWFEFHGT